MVEKFFIFTRMYGWIVVKDDYPFTPGELPKVLVVQNQEEHDYCQGLAYMYGYMPEIILHTLDYVPQKDCLFGREVLSTKEILY